MDEKSSQFSVSTKPLVFAALLFLFVLSVAIVHREFIVFRQDLDRFKDALYTQAESNLRDEVNHIVYELDFSISEVEATAFTTMDTFLTQTQSNYALLKANGISEHQRLKYLLNQSTQLDEGYVYGVFNEDNARLLYNQSSNSITESESYLYPLSKTDTTYALSNTNQELIIETTAQRFLIKTVTIGDYNIVISRDYNHLLTTHKESILETINREYHSFDDAPFIIGTDGHIYVHKYEDMIYDNIYDIDNQLFLDAFTKLKHALKTDNEVTKIYPFYTDNTLDAAEDHIAVATGYDQYDLIIGKSIKTETFDTVINTFINTSVTQFLTKTLPLYILTILSVTLGGYLVYRYTKKSALTIKQEEILYKRISDLSNQAIVILSEKKEIIFANKTAKKVIGPLSKDSNQNFESRLEPYDEYFVFQGFKQTYYVKIHKEQLTYHNQPAVLYFLEDVSNEVTSQKHLKAQVYKDVLTKLNNRRKLLIDYKTIMVPYMNNHKLGHLVIIDFDDFKAINDEHGHQYGDTALYEVAKVLRNYEDNYFSIYRIGGDEFVCLSYADRTTTINTLEAIKKEINALSFKSKHVDFTYGIIEINKKHRRSFEAYYDEADQKLYQFKQQKRGLKT